MSILEGKQIRKAYRSEDFKTEVLKGIDIEIAKGEFVCIMGKSGSGKSTLLNILSTLDSFESGEILFEGRSLAGLREEEASRLRRKSFGFVFQLPKFVKNLSILDNILLPSLQYEKDKKGAKAKARELMRTLGIEDIAEKNSSQASGGQLQRAGICRALINDPKLIFADEPTGALDSKSGEEVMALFAALKKEGRSILMVTHDAGVASQASRVLFMKDGLLQSERKLGEHTEENRTLIQELIETL